MTSTPLSYLEEELSNVMLILDPPSLPSSMHLSKDTSLNRFNLQQAHETLLWLAHDTTEGSIAPAADLYRAILVSSNLILELCPWHHPTCINDTSTLNKRAVLTLHSTIQQSIAMLERLAHISKLQGSELPKSQYPLLQECCDETLLLNVQDNVILGKEKALLSLVYNEYTFGETEWDQWWNSNCSNETDHEAEMCAVPGNGMEVDGESKEKTQLVNVPFLSAKELQIEETELLHVAFGQPLPPPSNQESPMMLALPQNVIQNAKGMNLGPYLFCPFKKNEAYPVIRYGSIILREVITGNNQKANLEALPSTPQPCEFYLLTNGILLLVHENPNTMESELILQCFSLYGSRSNAPEIFPQCTPTDAQVNDPFAFRLRNISLLYPDMNTVYRITAHITLAIQVKMGFMKGHQCMMKIKECMEGTCQKFWKEKEMENLLWG